MTRLYKTIRTLLITTVTLGVFTPLAAQAPVVHPPQPPRRVADSPARASFSIPEGMPISVRFTETVSSNTHTTGAIFEVILDQDIEVNDEVVIPRGTSFFGEVIDAKRGGKVQGKAELTALLREVELEGRRYVLQTNPITVVARGEKAKDAKKVGIAAGIGAVIGAIAGGKKGAAIGATIGGGAQTARVLTSRGDDAEFEREQMITFRLEEEFRYVPE